MKKNERTQITILRNGKEVITDSIDTIRLTRKQYDQTYTNKFNNLDEIDKCPQIHNLPHLTLNLNIEKILHYQKLFQKTCWSRR